jgi:hypothetical protein
MKAYGEEEVELHPVCIFMESKKKSKAFLATGCGGL